MPLDRRDPEFPSLRADLHWRFDQEFLAGRIGEMTYLRSLNLIGIPMAEARASLAECKSVQRTISHEEQRLAASHNWIKEYHARD